MNVLKTFRQCTCLAALSVAGLVGLMANRAQATHYFFDINGTTAGSGVTNNGSYSWEGNSWNATGAGNTTAPIAWLNGNNFPEFAAGTDAGASNYTVTAGADHIFAGMALQTSGGGTVTVASSGGHVLTLFENTGGQGFFVGGVAGQNLMITAPIAGPLDTPLYWQGALSGSPGSLFLYGNNTFLGGVILNTSTGLNFNNNNSFGTGKITWNVASQVISAPDATAPITIGNAVQTRAASTLIMATFAQPVNFGGGWTLANGTSTLDVRAGTDATISGIMSGTNGALTKISPGKLTLSGANTYTGVTTISGGTLELSGTSAKLGTGNVTVTGAGSSIVFDSGVHTAVPNSATLSVTNSATMTLSAGVNDAIGNSVALSLANSAILNLGSGVNERVGTLSLDTAFQPNGTYGSSLSNAVNKLDLYFSGTGILTVGPPILAGDYSGNGIVDAADYVLWRANVGQPSQTLQNDTTGVIIGDAQYNQWRGNFSSTTAVPGSGLAENGAAVPEPSSIGLLMLGLAALGVRTFRGMNGLSQLLRRR